MIKTTVVIPTLMKAPWHLQKNLEVLSEQDCNIILIDNTSTNICKKFENMSPRLKINYFPSNIGVNKAWNLGAAAASTEFLLVLNDDCLVWNRCIEKCEQVFQDKSIGILTFRTLTDIKPEIYYSLYKNQFEDSRFETLAPGQKTHTVGWFMFMRTKDYEQIPVELRIFYGDNYLYQFMRKKGYKTVRDNSNVLYHQTSSTVNTVFTTQQIHALFHNEGTLFDQIQHKTGIAGF